MNFIRNESRGNNFGVIGPYVIKSVTNGEGGQKLSKFATSFMDDPFGWIHPEIR